MNLPLSKENKHTQLPANYFLQISAKPSEPARFSEQFVHLQISSPPHVLPTNVLISIFSDILWANRPSIFYGITFSDSLALKPSNFMGIEGHRSDLIENEIIRPSCKTFIFYLLSEPKHFLDHWEFPQLGGFQADAVTKPRKWSFINSFHSWLSGQSLRKAVLLEYFPTFHRIYRDTFRDTIICLCLGNLAIVRVRVFG